MVPVCCRSEVALPHHHGLVQPADVLAARAGIVNCPCCLSASRPDSSANAPAASLAISRRQPRAARSPSGAGPPQMDSGRSPAGWPRPVSTGGAGRGTQQRSARSPGVLQPPPSATSRCKHRHGTCRQSACITVLAEVHDRIPHGSLALEVTRQMQEIIVVHKS
eukprot:CAMPEP_0175184342 /NCGR_PEP_ID=MMETSP0093-20121207/1315_1 /TAXON_ID=311494 /ORGANISM="Alexandrium monilatum, Strain CCMP3105" /LENGTH=163 /DNA_ID=CAMNT_0016477007 /DNA_START=41 /DNA_END=529 /DNA_ORIENTATION=-